LKVRLLNGSHRRIYALRLVVCSEVQHTLPVSHSDYRAGNPRMAVLPFFHQFSEHRPHLNSEAGYIFGKPAKFGVPVPAKFDVPIPHRSSPPSTIQVSSITTTRKGSMANARFHAADWPALRKETPSMTHDLLSRMMEYIGQRSQ
jgi:hypothetical protein